MKTLVLFILPFVIVLAPPIAILAITGELISVDSVIERQKGTTRVMYGVGFSDDTFYYKLQSVLSRKPVVVSVGTSRVMQFPAHFFKQPETFFNAGGIGGISHYQLFLDKIPKSDQPKVILLGLDTGSFNDRNAKRNDDVLPQHLDRPSSLLAKTLGKWPEVYKNLFNGKISFEKIFDRTQAQTEKIGLNAIMKNEGFMNDGSHHWAAADERDPGHHQADESIHAELENIAQGMSEFQNGGTEPSEIVLARVDAFLKQSSERGIYVVGFLTPRSHQAYERMKSDGRATYLDKLESTLRPIFEKYGFSVYNFSDPQSFGSADNEFINESHGSEKTYARLFISMVEKEEKLNALVDLPRLKERLEKSKSFLNLEQ